MPSFSCMPYAYLPEEPELRIMSLVIDGKDVDSFSPSQADLTPHEDWGRAIVGITLQAPAIHEVEKVLLEGENAEEAVRWSVVERGRDARIRRAWPMRATEGQLTASLELDRGDCAGAVRLQAVAVRRATARESLGFAWRKSERLGASTTCTLYVDEKPSMPGGNLPGEWVPFDDTPELEPYRDGLYHLRFEGDQPKLFLNESAAGLKVALLSEANTGRPARVRDAIFNAICVPVTLQLMTEAMTELHEVENLADLPSWAESALKTIASHSIDQSPEELISSWRTKWFDEHSPGRVMQEWSGLISRHLKDRVSSEHLISECLGGTDDE